MRCWAGGTAAHSVGEGLAAEPRVTEDMKPIRANVGAS